MATFSKETQCWRKFRFDTRAEANAMARRVKDAGHAGAEPDRLRAYRCSHCGYFHIGHYPKRAEAS